MVKEYCDRCKAEIDPHERLSKKVFRADHYSKPAELGWMHKISYIVL